MGAIILAWKMFNISITNHPQRHQNIKKSAIVSTMLNSPMHAHLQNCFTLCDPMNCSPPGSFVHGILEARILEWVAMPSSRGSSRPRDRTWVYYTGRQVLYTTPAGKPLLIDNSKINVMFWGTYMSIPAIKALDISQLSIREHLPKLWF